MRYRIDHDYHIHSYLSPCSSDPRQSAENILLYAKENKLGSIAVTDHYWDKTVAGASSWYAPLNFDHLSKIRPLPRDGETEFLFGCESDMRYDLTVGIPEQRYDDFDFIILPTTHLHMGPFTIDPEKGKSHQYRAEMWVRRLEALLASNLPFGKVGLAHPACKLIYRDTRDDYLKTLSLIKDEDMERLFAEAARLGLGIELNKSDMSFAENEMDIVLRMFRIAKYQGCKFYLGSDSHNPARFKDAIEIFDRAVGLLDLHEDDKFHIAR